MLKSSLQLVILLWEFGLVDTFTAATIFYNAATQYASIVVAAIADGNVKNLKSIPPTLLEPIRGLGVGYRFVKAAETAAERNRRVATLAAFLSTSTVGTFGSTPAANAGIGAGIASHISHMREALKIRGGFTFGSEVKIVLNTLKTSISEIHPSRAQFTSNSKMIIDNMFQEHTARRYLQGSAQQIKRVAPTYLAPITLTKIKIGVFVGWTCVGLGSIINSFL